jgi:TrmH family RNA methyltransferase
MVVKSELKLIKSLHQKKYRNEHGLFLVEGKKAVQELCASSLKMYKIFVTKDHGLSVGRADCIVVSEKELQQMSALKRSNGVIGIFHKPNSVPLEFNGWTLALDDIQDPGNLGTIIRLCDWFGITDLICSIGTVDCFNPKVLQATMGSIGRVNIVYGSLTDLLSQANVPIYGAFMEGAVVYDEIFPSQGVLVMGNEGKGISERIKSLCQQQIAVPQFGEKTTESLNVATATAILLNEIRRGQFGLTQK